MFNLDSGSSQDHEHQSDKEKLENIVLVKHCCVLKLVRVFVLRDFGEKSSLNLVKALLFVIFFNYYLFRFHKSK